MVLLIAEIYVILHNLLVSMAKKGELDEVASGEEGELPVDLVQNYSAALLPTVSAAGSFSAVLLRPAR